MIAAKACSVSEQTLREMSAHSGVSATRLGEASTVLKHAPELVESVISGAQSLDDAYALLALNAFGSAGVEQGADSSDGPRNGRRVMKHAFGLWREHLVNPPSESLGSLRAVDEDRGDCVPEVVVVQLFERGHHLKERTDFLPKGSLGGHVMALGFVLIHKVEYQAHRPLCRRG